MTPIEHREHNLRVYQAREKFKSLSPREQYERLAALKHVLHDNTTWSPHGAQDCHIKESLITINAATVRLLGLEVVP